MLAASLLVLIGLAALATFSWIRGAPLRSFPAYAELIGLVAEAPGHVASHPHERIVGWRGGEIPPPATHLVTTWRSGEHRKSALPEDSSATGVLLTLVPPPGAGSAVAGLGEGLFDQEIEELCRNLSRHAGLVYLRPMPAMDVPAARFPWQMHSPRAFISAYRRLADNCRTLASNIRMIWAPAGFPGEDEYLPGDEWIDAISITLQAPSLQQQAYLSVVNEPLEALRLHLQRLRFFPQPLLVLSAGSGELAVVRQVLRQIEPAAGAPGTAVLDRGNLEFRQATGLELPQPLQLGVYDPNRQLDSASAVSLEHHFTGWPALESGDLDTMLQQTFRRGRGAIVTVEPIPVPENSSVNVLEHFLAGHHDASVRRLFMTLAESGRPAYVRFAHEMEIPITRYAWQSQDAELYVAAFRHFARLRPAEADNVQIVWGPAGDRALMNFWPGAAFVDAISIAIYGLPDKNMDDHRQQETFADILSRKMWRLRMLDKPVFITEFGVKGPDDFQRQWLVGAAAELAEYPKVVGVSYFNRVDVPGAWGEETLPDWSVSPETLAAFIDALAARAPTPDY